LRLGNRSFASGTYLSAFACSRFRRGGFSGATRQHSPEFRNLNIDLMLLSRKACDGGGYDFRREIWQVNAGFLLRLLKDHLGTKKDRERMPVDLFLSPK
jgi:hypothetical protein